MSEMTHSFSDMRGSFGGSTRSDIAVSNPLVWAKLSRLVLAHRNSD